MFQKISDHIHIFPYMHATDRPNIGLIRGAERALLFDAGNSALHAQLIKESLSANGLPMPDLVAVSHWHWDHSFAMHAWNVPVIAGRETNEQLQRMSQWKWDDESMLRRIERGEDIQFCSEMIKLEYPDRDKIRVCCADLVFDEHLTVDLGGGVVCELIHARGPHSSDSVICYVPSDRFVFLGDSNGKDLYGQPWSFDISDPGSFLRETQFLRYDPVLVTEYLALLEPLAFTHCIGGHGGCMTKEELFSSFA